MKLAVHSVFLLCFCLFVVPIARAEQQVQYWLAAQHDWAACKGFFVSVQNVANPPIPAALKDCRVQFGVGDGSRWIFLEAKQDWKLDTAYEIHAVVREGKASISLNGKEVDEKAVAFKPADTEFSARYQPAFLAGPADYQVVQTAIALQGEHDQFQAQFQQDGDGAIASLKLLNPTLGRITRQFQSGDAVEVKATFIFKPAVDASKLGPLVDRYGQAVAADWPGKVTSDQQLIDNIAAEEAQLKQWPAPANLDRFGGIANGPWKSNATGFYRTEKRGEIWWLITPDGNPCFYLGACDAPSPKWEMTPVDHREHLFAELPPRDGVFAGVWGKNPWSFESADANYFTVHGVNLIRKYGESWKERSTVDAIARLRALGFSGYGKWSQAAPEMPIVEVLFPQNVDKISTHPDPWDPKVQRQIRDWFDRDVKPRKDDPFIVGWSISNERDAFPMADDVKKILAAPETTPARKAILAYAAEKSLDANSESGIEELRVFYAANLFKLYYQLIKEADPNHLYLGNWVTPNWWVTERDWDAIAPYCDVLGFDRYAMKLADEPLSRLMAKYDKPMMCGEFSFPPDYDGKRGHGTYPIAVRTEAEAGAKYAEWIADASKHPKLIGTIYFQYRDQPITGRGPGAGATAPVLGENFAFGLVDVTDRLKVPFCQAVRDANLKAAATRLHAAEE